MPKSEEKKPNEASEVKTSQKKKSKAPIVIIILIIGLLLLCCCAVVASPFLIEGAVYLLNEYTDANIEDTDYNWYEDWYEENIEDEDKDKDSTDSDTEDSDNDAEDDDSGSDTVIETDGKLTGTVSYPSEFIPDGLKVCAESSVSAQEYCTSNIYQDSSSQTGFAYELEVPEGGYYVYAIVPGDTYKAYYSEFVTCGMEVGCPSHTPILVTVRAGEMVEDIDPGDWYAM